MVDNTLPPVPQQVSSSDGEARSPHVLAVVLTYRRPRLATQVVLGLMEREGFSADEILVVVNGEGGLASVALEQQVRMLRLPVNTGPAGGFAAGMQAAEQTGAQWIYLCEDDVGLIDLPSGRVARVLAEVRAEQERTGASIGAVAAYGRTFSRRSGHTDPYVPVGPAALQPVDVAAWGATLVHRSVIEAGVVPDAQWFFGYEDFDFFLSLRSAGFLLLVDTESAQAVACQMTGDGRERNQLGARPSDSAEGWRAYYVARNFFFLARVHGNWRWVLWHLVFSGRRMQLAGSWADRLATVRGLVHGVRGRRGPHPVYSRQIGELSPNS